MCSGILSENTDLLCSQPMTHVHISPDDDWEFFYRISLNLEVIGTETILYVAAWRPGRYEESNYAKNIRNLRITKSNGESVFVTRNDKNSWKIVHHAAGELLVEYDYYAAELNAGSSYAGKELLYINPVNCVLFTDYSENRPFHLTFQKLNGLQYAGDRSFLKTESDASLHFVFPDYDTLADTPFYCSKQLISLNYESGGCLFTLYFTGKESIPGQTEILKHFSAFTKGCLQVFGAIPVKNYAFLFILPEENFYHGVEHLRSTVIVFGPAQKVFERANYQELLGIACHELFHVWNIKTIRPKLMLPYNLRKPVYCDAGLVYEGLTTFYGDWLLLRTAVFSKADYLQRLSAQLKKHLDNPGRYYHSITESCLDTWIDGYVAGIPGRKVSIYTEGCLLAFIIDIFIRKSSSGKRSLDDVMRALYVRFGEKSKGYDLSDYLNLLEEVAGRDLKSFFIKFIYSPASLEEPFKEALHEYGWKVEFQPADLAFAAVTGCQLVPDKNSCLVTAVIKNSPAFLAGIEKGHRLIFDPSGRLPYELTSEELCGNESMLFTLRNGEVERLVKLKADLPIYFKKPTIVEIS